VLHYMVDWTSIGPRGNKIQCVVFIIDDRTVSLVVQFVDASIVCVILVSIPTVFLGSVFMSACPIK
jgi:orotate phosphoribosyltransferase-like protein